MRRLSHTPSRYHLIAVAVSVFVIIAFDITRAQDDSLPDLLPITTSNVSQLRQISTNESGGDLTGSAWSPNDTWIAYTTPHGVWLIADDGTPEQIASSPHAHYPIFSADERLLAWAQTDFAGLSMIRVWDTLERRIIANLQAGEAWLIQLVFSPDGSQIYSGNERGQLAAWNIQSQRMIQLEAVAKPASGWRFFLLPSGEFIVNKDSSVWRYSADLQPIRKLIEWGWAELHPSGKWLAVSTSNSTVGRSHIELYDLDSETFTLSSDYESIGILGELRWNTTGTHLFFRAITGTYLIWDITTNSWSSLFIYDEASWSDCTQCSDSRGEQVLTSNFRPDMTVQNLNDITLDIVQVADNTLRSSTLISSRQSSQNCTPQTLNQVYRTVQQEPQQQFNCLDFTRVPEELLARSDSALAQSPDGTLIAGTNSSFTTYLWQAQTGEIVASYPTGRMDTHPISPSFSRDGLFVAMPHAEGGSQIIDTRSFEVIARLEEVSYPLFSAAHDLLTTVSFTLTDGVVSRSIRIFDTSALTEELAIDPLSTPQALPLVYELPLVDSSPPRTAISQDGRTLAVFTETNMTFLDLDHFSFVQYDTAPFLLGGGQAATITPDGSVAIFLMHKSHTVRFRMGQVVFMETSTGRILHRLSMPLNTSFVISQQGDVLATSSNHDGAVYLWGVPD